MATDSTSLVGRAAADFARASDGVLARVGDQALPNAIAGGAGATDDIRADGAGKRSRSETL